MKKDFIIAYILIVLSFIANGQTVDTATLTKSIGGKDLTGFSIQVEGDKRDLQKALVGQLKTKYKVKKLSCKNDMCESLATTIPGLVDKTGDLLLFFEDGKKANSSKVFIVYALGYEKQIDASDPIEFDNLKRIGIRAAYAHYYDIYNDEAKALESIVRERKRNYNSTKNVSDNFSKRITVLDKIAKENPDYKIEIEKEQSAIKESISTINQLLNQIEIGTKAIEADLKKVTDKMAFCKANS